MLKDWHLEDILEVLTARGWSKPTRDDSVSEAYFVGRSYTAMRGSESLLLVFVADVGEGYVGEHSLEEVVASRGSGEARLWLHRQRASKWRRELLAWVEVISETRG